MELGSVDMVTTYISDSASNKGIESVESVNTANTTQGSDVGQQEDKSSLAKKPVKKEELDNWLNKMNKAMEALDSSIRFKYHEKTKTLIVQVVDIATNKVLKEFPPHEFLDTKAKISEYIGILLDLKI